MSLALCTFSGLAGGRHNLGNLRSAPVPSEVRTVPAALLVSGSVHDSDLHDSDLVQIEKSVQHRLITFTDYKSHPLTFASEERVLNDFSD